MHRLTRLASIYLCRSQTATRRVRRDCITPSQNWIQRRPIGDTTLRMRTLLRAVSAGSRGKEGKGRGELPPSWIQQDQPEVWPACLLRYLHRSARDRCSYACSRHCRPCYHRRCQTGSSGADTFAFSAALSALWPVQMHTSAWAMVRWACEGTLAAMSNQCLLSSCCSELIEGPVYESPQGCHALNKPNLCADRQKTSIHALNKLHPTRPPLESCKLGTS